jgi:hypothetical protein
VVGYPCPLPRLRVVVLCAVLVTLFPAAARAASVGVSDDYGNASRVEFTPDIATGDVGSALLDNRSVGFNGPGSLGRYAKRPIGRAYDAAKVDHMWCGALGVTMVCGDEYLAFGKVWEFQALVSARENINAYWATQFQSVPVGATLYVDDGSSFSYNPTDTATLTIVKSWRRYWRRSPRSCLLSAGTARTPPPPGTLSANGPNCYGNVAAVVASERARHRPLRVSFGDDADDWRCNYQRGLYACVNKVGDAFHYRP